MPEARPDYVQSLERGLAVLTSFSGETPALTLSDVARRTGLTRATARRLLLTLEELGYVGSDGRLFHLRPKTLDIGYAYLSSLPVAEIEKISSLGGRTVQEPMDVPNGPTIALFADPEGHVVGLVKRG